jgi:NAD(P)H-quinone oxidoreductase subunit 5
VAVKRNGERIIAGPLLNTIGLITATLTTLIALAITHSVWTSGTLRLEIGGWGVPLGIALQADGLSAAMLLLVAFLGVVVTESARTQLAEDPRQSLFLGQLSLTLAAVALLMISANLIELVFAWVATSLGLHRLLLFRKERPGARAAARKKFLVARLGDGCLLVAVVLLASTFHTTDLQALLAAVDAARARDAVPAALPVAAAALAGAAVLKSALFPFHGWLLDVMETPTPVSALLLAGIVNAGGFLLLRFADVLLAAPAVMACIAVLGAASALLGALVMLVQTRVKASLAWSTVAQMGFLLLQCGLGAFSAAALHLLAHALFKAHAFLATDEAIARPVLGTAANAGSAGAVPTGLRALSLLALLGVLGLAAGARPETAPALLALGALFAIGLWQMVAAAASPSAFLVRLVFAALLVPFWLFLQEAAAQRLAGLFPAPGAVSPVVEAALVVLVVLAVLLALLQLAIRGDALRRVRVHLAAGLYANVLLDRMVGAHRVRVYFSA